MKNSDRCKLAKTVLPTVALLPNGTHNTYIRYPMGNSKALGATLLLLFIGLSYGLAAYFDEADQQRIERLEHIDQQSIGAENEHSNDDPR